MPNLEDYARADALARALMDVRPDLKRMSLDEWIHEHAENLRADELRAAHAVLALHPDCRDI